MLKVLCLHGFGTNAEILRYQLTRANWDSKWNKLVSFHVINAPHQTEGFEALKRIAPGPYYCWWDAQTKADGSKVYQGWKQSVSYLADYITKEGPFHGIVGFSQGACLASLILSFQQQQISEFENSVPFQFAILVAGFLSRDADHKEAYIDPIRCRTLHIYGEEDMSKAGSQLLIHKHVDPVVITHAHGHEIPRLDHTNENLFTTFLKSCVSLSRL